MTEFESSVHQLRRQATEMKESSTFHTLNKI